MISTPKLAPDSRNVSGFHSLTCGFTGSLPFVAEHRRDLRLTYYFHGGEVLTSRPILVERLLLLPWLVYQEYPPGTGRSRWSERFWCEWVPCVVHVVVVWPRERTKEFHRHYRMHIWGDTRISLHSFIWLQRGCSRPRDTFAPHRVLMRLKVAEKSSWRLRLAGPSLGKSLSIGLASRTSRRRQPCCWESPSLSGVWCVVFSVAVNVSCHVAIRASPPSISSGL